MVFKNILYYVLFFYFSTFILIDMLYELYIEFVKDNWKLYSVIIVLLLGLPLQKIAIPHYYGKIIETIKDGKLGT